MAKKTYQLTVNVDSGIAEFPVIDVFSMPGLEAVEKDRQVFYQTPAIFDLPPGAYEVRVRSVVRRGDAETPHEMSRYVFLSNENQETRITTEYKEQINGS